MLRTRKTGKNPISEKKYRKAYKKIKLYKKKTKKKRTEILTLESSFTFSVLPLKIYINIIRLL